jgi:hypothetical protein
MSTLIKKLHLKRETVRSLHVKAGVRAGDDKAGQSGNGGVGGGVRSGPHGNPSDGLGFRDYGNNLGNLGNLGNVAGGNFGQHG